jgi:FAD dependent oxidoreductase TIGR03364
MNTPLPNEPPAANRFDVAIVGGGIVGLAHAWAAVRLGLSVIVFDRHRQPHGASVRNFGMVWPIGQPPGSAYEIALRSRSLWLQLAERAGLWAEPVGSLHVAYRDDEYAVLHEFADRAPELGYACELLDASATLQRSRAVQPSGLLGSLWSPTELCVHPRKVIAEFPKYLAREHRVTLAYESLVTHVDSEEVRTADGRTWRVGHTIVCSGAEIDALFPTAYQGAGLKHCKLQMLRTAAQPSGWRLGPHLAGGLTLQHYKNFDACPSLKALRNRIAAESPEINRYGIHVMASQNDDGQIILGDSHEYGDAIEPFDKEEIDALILRELRRFLVLPDWSIDERWHGVYLKHPSEPCFVANPIANVTLVTATGGAGMTMSLGLAERTLNTISNRNIEETGV